MTLITIPASNAIFEAAGEAPKTDAGWESVKDNALLIAESGNLLMMAGRARDNQEWMNEARGMVDAALVVMNAAAAKNADKLAEAGDKVYTTCETCHEKYMAK